MFVNTEFIKKKWKKYDRKNKIICYSLLKERICVTVTWIEWKKACGQLSGHLWCCHFSVLKSLMRSCMPIQSSSAPSLMVICLFVLIHQPDVFVCKWTYASIKALVWPSFAPNALVVQSPHHLLQHHIWPVRLKAIIDFCS